MARLTRTTLAGTAAIVVAACLTALVPNVAFATTTSATTTTTATIRTASSADVFGAGPLVVANSSAAQAAASLATSDPTGAAAASAIAKYPVATWLGEWSTGATLTKTLTTQTTAAASLGTTPVFVVYGIPDRDCGGYSAGGFTTSTYNTWTDQIASTLQGKRAVVIVEPDALAMISSCADVASTRYTLLSHEMKAFADAGVPAYLDAGNSNWVAPAVMAQRLVSAGVAYGRGFSSNVSNYYPIANEVAYDDKVSALTNGAHYVIDTSRNGQGYKGTWCNAPGAGLGTTPRIVSNGTALDALLWVKTPGASDGTCNGGPAAGAWYSTYAKALVANAVLSTATAGTTDTLLPGQSLTAGKALVDTTGTRRLVDQSDGNVVLYEPTKVGWATMSLRKGATRLTLQTDGNLVVYTTAGKALWSTQTQKYGSAGMRLVLQPDGNLVLYKASKAVWNTRTNR